MPRKISVEILGDSRSVERAFGRSTRAGQKFNVGIGTIAKSAVVFEGVRRGIDALTGGIRAGVAEWSEQVRVAAQTNAALRSTRNIANVTARGVERLAGRISRLSGIDDELVQQGANLILTFKNVRNELGKGNRIFDRATKAAVDLSVAGFGAIDSTAKQLAKALNDPVRGMTALGRAGVTFTQDQRDLIRALVESNRTLDAQRIILREVESQVGGSAKALGETLPGHLSRMRESLKNTFGDLVGIVVPSLTGVLDHVNRFIDRLSEARTVRAKLNVVWQGARDAATSATAGLERAVERIDWDAVWSQARGVADGLQRQLERVDFGFVGQRIGEGIAQAVRVAIPAAKELAERINRAIRAIDFESLGKELGPGLATAVLSAFVALGDPAFWARNWDLALGVAATVFRARILALGAKLVAPIGRFGAGIVLAAAAGIERASPRLAAAFLAAMTRLPRIAGRALAPLTRVVTGVFERLGRVAQFTVRVVGIGIALRAIVDFGKSAVATIGQALSDAAREAYAKARAIGVAIKDGILDGLGDIGGAIWGKMKGALGGLKDRVGGLLGIGSPSRVFMEIGKAIGDGLTLGIERSSKGLDRPLRKQLDVLERAARQAQLEVGLGTRQQTAKPLTPFGLPSTKKLLGGVDLSRVGAEEFKRMRAKLTRLGSNAVPGAAGLAIPSVAPAGGGAIRGGDSFHIGTIVVQDPRDADAFVREVQKKARRSSGTRTGPGAGRNRGLG